VRRFASRGATVFLVGHGDHDEVIGTRGEAPESVVLIETVADAERVAVPDPDNVALTTQTTLSVDDTAEIVEVLKRRFPALVGPKSSDICYATQNRQDAVKAMAPHVDMLLVLGAPNSSNSLRMCEVARANGVASHLIERARDIRPGVPRGLPGPRLPAPGSGPRAPRPGGAPPRRPAAGMGARPRGCAGSAAGPSPRSGTSWGRSRPPPSPASFRSGNISATTACTGSTDWPAPSNSCRVRCRRAGSMLMRCPVAPSGTRARAASPG